MTTRVATPDVLEREVAPTLPTRAGSGVDVQVATAKQYPRSITSFIQRAREMATLNADVAAACVYALPRDGKTIEGPSARLAEICAHAWGNLRIQAGTSDQDERFITGRGEAWDVEANVAIGFEVRRRITNRNGQTYNDDMITVTGNAAASIALRNAVFKAIPAAFWKPIYNECRKVIAGDVRTFAVRRDEMFKLFAVMGVTEARLVAALNLKGKADITIEHMVTLNGYYNALKDNETTIEEAFPDSGGLGTVQPAQRKSQQAESAAAPTPAAETTAPATQAEAPAMNVNPRIGTVVEAKEMTTRSGAPAVVVKLSTGYRCGTGNPDLIAAVKALLGTSTQVELSTRKAATAGSADILEEILVLETATA